MQESKSCALPLGDGPEHNKYSLTQEREIFNKKERKKYDMTHGEKAGALFLEGYNCAQSVVLAFADEMGIPKETAARIASSFGGGLGRLREVCGCVSGMAIVAGELLGYSGPETRKPKADHYVLIQELAEEFRKENGSIICRDLLSGITSDAAPVPEARTDDYYKKRPCKDLAVCAAEILERKLEERKVQDLEKNGQK